MVWATDRDLELDELMRAVNGVEVCGNGRARRRTPLWP
jgi:hypothetical protein